MYLNGGRELSRIILIYSDRNLYTPTNFRYLISTVETSPPNPNSKPNLPFQTWSAHRMLRSEETKCQQPKDSKPKQLTKTISFFVWWYKVSNIAFLSQLVKEFQSHLTKNEIKKEEHTSLLDNI